MSAEGLLDPSADPGPRAAGTGVEDGGTRPSWLPRTLQSTLIVLTVLVLGLMGTGIGISAVLVERSVLLTDLDSRLGELSHTADPGPRGPGAVDPLNFLSMPGIGDGTLAMITDGTDARGEVVRQGRTVAVELSDEVVVELMGVSPGAAPTTVDLPGLGDYRVLAQDVEGYTTDVRIVYGIPQTEVDAAVARTTGVTLVVAAVAVILAAGLASILISRALRPLRSVARTAREVSHLDLVHEAGGLEVRVDPSLTRPGTEVGDVGASLNLMLDNVDSSLRARTRAEEAQKDFVADASHELRTPLAAIRGYADLTRASRIECPPQVVTSLERIDAGVVRMSGLVDDLLLLARLDAGRDPLAIGKVDVSADLIDLVGDAHVTSPAHRFLLDLPAEPVVALADERKLHAVLSNVVTNAWVHTPEGTRVSVAARLEPSQAVTPGVVDELGPRNTGPEADVVVEIADDGPGIPGGLLPQVFDRFVKSGSSRTRSAAQQSAGGSSGLGLAIARSLVESMSGSIDVSSSSAGTVFTIRVPAARREHA